MTLPDTVRINTREYLIKTAIGILNHDDANPQVGMGKSVDTALREAAGTVGLNLTWQDTASLRKEVLDRRDLNGNRYEGL